VEVQVLQALLVHASYLAIENLLFQPY